MRIILVEDDALVALTTETLLRLHGHDILGPFSKACEVFRIIASGPPHLALIDIELKGRCSGLDCARVLVKRYGVPTVFVSAYPHKARHGEGSGLGYLTKPVSLDDLLGAVRVVDDVVHGRVPKFCPLGLTLFRRPDGLLRPM